jgi:hypothetical protein
LRRVEQALIDVGAPDRSERGDPGGLQVAWIQRQAERMRKLNTNINEAVRFAEDALTRRHLSLLLLAAKGRREYADAAPDGQAKQGDGTVVVRDPAPAEAEVCPSLCLDYEDLFACTATGKHDVHRFNALKWTDEQAVPSPWPVDREPPAGINCLRDMADGQYLCRASTGGWWWARSLSDRDNTPPSGDGSIWAAMTVAANGDLIVVRP